MPVVFGVLALLLETGLIVHLAQEHPLSDAYFAERQLAVAVGAFETGLVILVAVHHLCREGKTRAQRFG